MPAFFRKLSAAVLAMSLGFAFQAGAADETASPFSLIPFLKVYDPTGQDSGVWKKENDKAEIGFSTYRGITTLEASDPERPWSAMYRPVSVNLDQHPILEIGVLSVSKQWYLILAGDQFDGGYTRLIESKDTGSFSFDIPKLTGLKGQQKFEVKIGVSDPEGTPLSGEKVVFDKLAFVARPDGASEQAAKVPAAKKRFKPRKDGSFYVFDPSNENLDQWQEAAKDGPEEVRFDVHDGVAVVKGAIAERNWGAVHREVAVNLKRLPVLEIHVPACSKRWYLILANPRLPNGYVRLIETDKPGTYRFNIPKETGLEDIQVFDLQVGVSTPDSPSVKGEWMSFDTLRFCRS